MALSLGLVSGLETTTLWLRPSVSPSSSRLAAAPLANLRSARTVTIAASSKPTAEPKKRRVGGIMLPRRVSPEMQAFLGGVAEISRAQVLKEVWAYIKQNNLQDPTDKKVIVCDEKLKKIFGGRDRVGFLEVAGLISPHLL